MNTATQNKGVKVKEGRTELAVPHKDGELTFIHPYHGPNVYADVALSIQQAGLQTPTLAETASLVHAAFPSEDKYSTEIKALMKKRYFWASTGIHYVPKEGAYIQDHPEIRKGMPFMEKSELARKLEAHDPSVRFVPFGYKTEIMSALELASNPFIQALAGGEEGAGKLAEIADKHRNRPYIWSFSSVDEPITRVAALDSHWNVGDHRLNVNGNNHGNNRNGCAFGIALATKITHMKTYTNLYQQIISKDNLYQA